jgi:RRXRR protein
VCQIVAATALPPDRFEEQCALRNRRAVVCDVTRAKSNPGSRTTGIAVVADEDGNKPARVLCLFELARQGRQISEALAARRAFRRRGANLRYRAPRFDNTRKPQGWLAPNLQHRVDTCMSWCKRFDRLAPVSALRAECVRFDMQLQTQVGRAVVGGSGSVAGAINAKCCKILHRADGYCYARHPALPPRPEQRGFQRRRL